MNIMRKLTLIHLKQNKKRTIVTVLGIIISVAMITAVGTGYTSILNFMREYQISHYGRWHVEYNMDYKDAKEKIKDSNVKSSMLTKEVGYAKLEGSMNIDKPYLYVNAYDKKAFDNMGLRLMEGRFPEKDNEVVLSYHIISNGQVEYKIGDKITLNLGKRFPKGSTSEEDALSQYNPLIWNDTSTEVLEELRLDGTKKEYTIVGIMERPGNEPFSAPGYTLLTCLNKEELTDDSMVSAFVFLKDVNKDYMDAARDMGANINYNVTDFYGYSAFRSIQTLMIGLSVILMVIIMGGSISLIYNAFAISATDRSKQFGILGSVGATRRQKRNAVLFEAVVMSGIGIPVGIISGIVGLSIAFQYVDRMFKNAFNVDVGVTMYVPITIIFVAACISAFTILLSAWLPARRASKMSPIEAIRGNKDVKLTKRKVRTSKLNRLLFGFEGELALKNMKRNKKQYRSLILSLALTFVLFTSVTTYTYYIQESLKVGKAVENYDIAISKYNHTGAGGDTEVDELAIYDDIKEIDSIDEFNLLYMSGMDLRINTEDSLRLTSKKMKQVIENKDFIESYGDLRQEFNFYTNVAIMDQEDYDRYIKQIGNPKLTKVDGADLEGVFISNHRISYGGKRVVLDTMDVNVGDMIPHELDVYDDNGNITVNKRAVKIGVSAVTTQYPMGYSNAYFYITSPMLVVSKPQMDAFIKNNPEISQNYNWRICLTTSEPLNVEKEINEVLKANNANGVCNVYNLADRRGRDQSLLDMINIFVGGFISLISLICIANLCNTISTSFELRRREFAMLKSVGMDPRKYNRMIRFESLFYGIKAMIFGLPISLLLCYWIAKENSRVFDYEMVIPYHYFIIGAAGIFAIILIGMRYASVRIRKENVIDGLRI